MSSYSYFHHAPKVELHLHLDGAFDLDLLYEVALRDIDSLPETVFAPWSGENLQVRSAIAACKDKASFEKLVCLGATDVVTKRLNNGGKPGAGLACMLDCFAIFTPIVQGKRDVIEEMAFRVCTRQYLENVMYTELRYNPHLLCLKGSTLPTPRSVVDAVTAGIARGVAQYGIVMNQILCCIDRMPEASAEVAELAIEYKSSGVVAVDVAAGENHFDDEEAKKAHVAACTRAKEAGLHVTVHAAEDGPSAAKHFCCAIREYQAERVGHAYKIAEHPELMQIARDTNTHIEACPTSSICTESVCLPEINPDADDVLDRLDWTVHPIKKFIQEGLSMSVSTDDPVVFLTNLSNELSILADRLGLDARETGLKVTLDAIDRSWANESVKDDIAGRVKAFYSSDELASTRDSDTSL